MQLKFSSPPPPGRGLSHNLSLFQPAPAERNCNEENGLENKKNKGSSLTKCVFLFDSLSFLQHAGPAFIHLLHGRRGGEERVVRGIEGGGAAVSLFHRQRAGPVLQSLHQGTHKVNQTHTWHMIC